MGKYSVPEEIRKLKPKGTMVKNIKGLFYVYNYSSRQICTEDESGKKHWKTKTTMGDCIGSITLADGFVPNEGHLSKDIITCKNYGDYAAALYYSRMTYELLSSVFHPDDAEQIYSRQRSYFLSKVLPT